jgi:hypothetical protein
MFSARDQDRNTRFPFGKKSRRERRADLLGNRDVMIPCIKCQGPVVKGGSCPHCGTSN